MKENPLFLQEQILTYLGNKRSLLGFIERGVDFAKKELKKDKLSCVDLFSGSGVVARFLKQHSSYILANDLELYSKVINECYLSNQKDILMQEISSFHSYLLQTAEKNPTQGIISTLYSPKDEANITKNDRVFYTNYNAIYIDTIRQLIKNHKYEKYFLAPLLYIASVHVNTSGVFKGFYKNKKGIGQFGGEAQNALSRITKKMILPMPIFSNFDVKYDITQEDANALAKDINCDLCYIDPPYNQHPYGSNYFMLNLIANYEKPSKISKISGIVQGWNKSVYNVKNQATNAFFELIANLRSKIIIISYSNEGFISDVDFEKGLSKFGEFYTLEQKYNTFRASRNLNARKKHVSERLYILKKSPK